MLESQRRRFSPGMFLQRTDSGKVLYTIAYQNEHRGS